MANKITSWRVLREDGKNIAWVNDCFVGVVSDEQVAAYEAVCPTTGAGDLASPVAEGRCIHGLLICSYCDLSWTPSA